MPSVVPPHTSPAIVEALVGRVTELERTQQQEDVEGFLALFDPDAVWVTGGGRRFIGLETISAFTRSVLPGAMTESSVTYQVEHVLVITETSLSPASTSNTSTSRATPRQPASPPTSGETAKAYGASSPAKTPASPTRRSALFRWLRDLVRGWKTN